MLVVDCVQTKYESKRRPYRPPPHHGGTCGSFLLIQTIGDLGSTETSDINFRNNYFCVFL